MKSSCIAVMFSTTLIHTYCAKVSSLISENCIHRKMPSEGLHSGVDLELEDGVNNEPNAQKMQL